MGRLDPATLTNNEQCQIGNQREDQEHYFVDTKERVYDDVPGLAWHRKKPGLQAIRKFWCEDQKNHPKGHDANIKDCAPHEKIGHYRDSHVVPPSSAGSIKLLRRTG